MAATAHRWSSIYDGHDPEEIPRYTLVEGAHYLRLPPATLSSWVSGRSYPVAEGRRRSTRLIRRPSATDTRLSFCNLVEAYVLKALRSTYKVKMSAIRKALSGAERKYGIDRLLLSDQLRAAPGRLFLERYEQLIDLQQPSQGVFREVFDAYLARLDYESGRALKLYPIARRDGHQGPKIVAIDPRISFGRPTVEPKGIRTAAIAERFDIGESLHEIADDYDLGLDRVEEAIRYERWSERAA